MKGPVEIVNSDLFDFREEFRREINQERLERAKGIFTEDFLCQQAISNMEAKCQQAGINVRFEIPEITPFSDERLNEAKADTARGMERFFVLRPEVMIVNNVRQPITIETLNALFSDKNPFGQGKLLSASSLEYEASLAVDEIAISYWREKLKPAYAVPTKDILPESQRMLASFHKKSNCRTPVERVWDTILYYAATGIKLLQMTGDYGYDKRVFVGHFDTNGRWDLPGSGLTIFYDAYGDNSVWKMRGAGSCHTLLK